MKFRFSLRTLLVATTFACISVFLYVKYWPVSGPPNLIGSLVDSKGNPTADAEIRIYDCEPWAQAALPPRWKTKSDYRGNFRFESVDLSTNRPYVGLWGDERGQFKHAFFRIQVEHETHFLANSLTEPSSYQTVKLVKDRNYAFEFEMSLGGMVSGRLTNEFGVPLGNKQVRFVCQSEPRYVRVFRTDQAGRFITFALPPQAFDVELIETTPYLDFFRKHGEVQVKAGETVELELQIPIASEDNDSIRNSSKPDNSDLPSE